MVKYRKWSNEEVIALLDGIIKYGLGKWNTILKDPQFTPYLINRSYTNLKDKWRNLGVIGDKSNIKEIVTSLRRDLIRKRPSKKEVAAEEIRNYRNQCTVRGNHSSPINRTRKFNSEKVDDNLIHQSPLSSENKLVEQLSDSEDYHIPCTIAPQKIESRSNTVNQSNKSNSERVHDNFPHQELSTKELVKDLSSDSEEYIPCTITRQRRGTRSKMNHERMLNSDKVHIYLENLWLNFPDDKKSSFTHLDPLWYTLYSNDSDKEKVLKWIKKKDVFSREYVVFPIVQWGHWSVLIFCHFGEILGSKEKTPCILLLDSLEKTDHSKQLEPIIRKFVSDIYKTLEITEDIKMLRKIPFLVPKVPQQRDSEECGFFVLYYIKLFVENAPESFSISNGYPYFMKKDWFDFEGLDGFCKTLDSDLSHK